MGDPVLGFSLESLNFQNRFLSGNNLSTATTSSQPVIHQIPSQENDDLHKDVNLASGGKIKLKRKPKTESKNLDKLINDAIESLAEQKENSGFHINELYSKLELAKNKSQSKDKVDSYIDYQEVGKNDILWAEKWRPTTFLDFVGNEATNRKILRWIKQWNRVVFDKNFKPVTTQDSKEMSKFSDPFGRPDRKVLLIHGPPGLGKTTVAHVIAKQAGYEVMEVNASDERSGLRVKEKVNNSLTSLTFSGKPICLIADEVDGGAEFGFIKVLLDIINEDIKTVKNFQKSAESSKFLQQSGNKKPKFLLRPIIAICNDVYAPALEKLRMNSEIITFQQATEKALRDRLKFICDSEKINITNQQLREIILLTNYDIRSCLNILQFGGNLNSSSDLRKKDSQISWFTVVNEIFQKQTKKSKNEQFKELSDIISTNSNYEKIVHGCFQSYHDVHYQDIKLSKPGIISDWLFFGDIMSKAQFESIGDLSYYNTQVALQFFNLFGDLSNRSSLKIKSDYEFHERKKINDNLIKSIYSNITPVLQSIFKLEHLPLEFLPLLDYILIPERRTLASLTPAEISKLQGAIDAINGIGLHIQKGKDLNYNEIYKTYPEFTSLTKFDPANIRRQQQRQTQVFPTLLKEMSSLKAKKRAFDELNGTERSSTSEGIASLKTQYNRLAEAETKAKRQKTSTVVKVWVKYHEGFSNAVRKNVKWNNLWQ